MQKSKVTIVGGGIPGLTLAIILADNHCDVTVIDRYILPTQKEITPSARTAALMQGSLDVLARAGVWPNFQPQSTALNHLTIIDDSTYPRGEKNMVRQDFDAFELGLDMFGCNIPLLSMTATLADRVKDHKNITLIEGIEIESTHDAITNADLIVGADGRNSIVRQWSGIDADIKHYDQSAITCLISHSQPHNNRSIEFHRPHGPCTFVPYAEGQSSVVWVDDKTATDGFLKLPKQAFIHALQSRSRGLLGQIDDIIVGAQAWPLMTLKARTIVAPKTILIAEAAHVASPIGAQGLNISLRDVDALAIHIDEAIKNGQDIGSTSVLRNYERARQKDVSVRLKGIDLFHQTVANDNIIVRGLRRLGLHAIGMQSPLRSLLMQEGLAPKSRD